MRYKFTQPELVLIQAPAWSELSPSQSLGRAELSRPSCPQADVLLPSEHSEGMEAVQREEHGGTRTYVRSLGWSW